MKRLSPYPNPVDDGPDKWWKLFNEYLEELRQARIEEEFERETGEEIENMIEESDEWEIDFSLEVPPIIENPEEDEDLKKEN